MVMAGFAITLTSVPSSLLHRYQSPSPPLPPAPLIVSFLPRYKQQLVCDRRRRSRGSSVVTRGTPGTGTYIFAFVFPLSLLVVTIFTAIRISDKLDQDYYEELAVNQAILEADDYYDDDEDEDEDADEDEDKDEDVETPIKEEEPTLPRTRNRPKREAEVSSR